MLKKDNFFQGYFSRTKKYYINLKKTKKVFSTFINDLNNSKIPMLRSYESEYDFDFSNKTIKKYSKYKNIVIIGMGGSILGAKTIYSFFKKKIKKKIFFLDNLDLNFEYKKIKSLKNVCFILVSKSGNTLESITNFNILFSKKLFNNKLILITETADNKLMAIANKCNAEIIEHKKFIGGRFSVMSETGMFPAALMNLNLKKFKNLKKLLKDKNFIASLIQNVASIYTLNTNNIKNSIILNYDSSLTDLGYWYQQLVAESLGKKGKGINPMLSFGPKDHHSLLQLYLDGPRDKFFTFFNLEKKIKGNHDFKNLKKIINAQSKALKKVFKLKKIPFRYINFKKMNENELGEILTFFVLETILLSRMMGINAFDQPAVEQVKTETKKIL